MASQGSKISSGWTANFDQSVRIWQIDLNIYSVLMPYGNFLMFNSLHECAAVVSFFVVRIRNFVYRFQCG